MYSKTDTNKQTHAHTYQERKGGAHVYQAGAAGRGSGSGYQQGAAVNGTGAAMMTNAYAAARQGYPTTAGVYGLGVAAGIVPG